MDSVAKKGNNFFKYHLLHCKHKVEMSYNSSYWLQNKVETTRLSQILNTCTQIVGGLTRCCWLFVLIIQIKFWCYSIVLSYRVNHYSTVLLSFLSYNRTLFINYNNNNDVINRVLNDARSVVGENTKKCV